MGKKFRRIFGKFKVKIIFSDHAKKQLAERKISRKFVLEAVKSPENKIKSFKNRELRKRRFSGKILEVVIVEEADSAIVITEYYLEGEES